MNENSAQDAIVRINVEGRGSDLRWQVDKDIIALATTTNNIIMASWRDHIVEFDINGTQLRQHVIPQISHLEVKETIPFHCGEHASDIVIGDVSVINIQILISPSLWQAAF